MREILKLLLKCYCSDEIKENEICRHAAGMKYLVEEREVTRAIKKHRINPLNAELNPICCLLALLGAHHFLHVSRIRVKSLTLRLLMSYIYIYDISSLRVK